MKSVNVSGTDVRALAETEMMRAPHVWVDGGPLAETENSTGKV